MSYIKDDWRHAQKWKKEGSDFLVEVSLHQADLVRDGGPNRWCVYAYIYPAHPLFGEFKGGGFFQEAACKLPLHCYCSFLTYHRNESDVTSIQVGADYGHIDDWAYTLESTPEEASGVFRDALRLFEFLTNCVKVDKEEGLINV